MEKIERDGKIAVLYTPNSSAGWSSWARDGWEASLCMDARIVGPFLNGDKAAALEAARAMVPNLYTGGFRNLAVFWVEKGKMFEIEEYDGSETVHVIGSRKYLVA